MIKILEYNVIGDRVDVALLYPDNTVGMTNLVYTDKETALSDAYIITKNNRHPYNGEIPEGLEEFRIDNTPTEIVINDWYELDGVVTNKYGDELDNPINWSIEGSGAKIENDKVVTDEVDVETSFFIVANSGELEERKEFTLYPAPVIEEPNYGERINNLEEVVDTMIGGDGE